MPDDSFKEFVLDQLRALPELRAKAMFGGYGLYSGARFFAILAEGQLYFKVDAAGRAAFIERGMKPFTYGRANKLMTMSYYEVPAEVLENPVMAVAWAQQSILLAAANHRPQRLGPKPKRH